VAEVVEWMKRLNRTTSELAVEFGLRGGTDVTGFSLLGHGLEIAKASGVGLRFHYEKIPFIAGARRYAEQWIFPGGTLDNRSYFGAQVHFAPGIEEISQLLMFDAQTSGGLLLSVPVGKVEAMMDWAAQVGQLLWSIGEVVPGSEIEVI
jgi:selenide,water dikinase